MTVVLELDPCELEYAAALDEDLRMSVDQDIVDRGVLEQRLDRTESLDLVDDVGNDLLLLFRIQRRLVAFQKLLDQAVYSRVSVTDMEVDAHFKANRGQFDRPAQVRARQIVVAVEAEGQEALGLLRQGQPFAEVAAKYSLSPDSQQGGDLGFFARGEMPLEFDEIVFDLPVNRLSDLVKSEYGYHIFLVEEKRKAARLSKKEATEEIRSILESRKKEEVYLGWLQDMRARAVIAVDWTQLEENNKKTQ